MLRDALAYSEGAFCSPLSQPLGLTRIQSHEARWPPCPVAPLVGGHRHIAAGMAWQQDDLELARHGEEGWRATFYPAGIAHSMTGSVGTAWQTTPFDAVPGRGARSAPQREQRTVPTMVTRP